MSLNYAKIQADANKLHANAKDGVLSVNGVKYVFVFNHYHGYYEVHGPDGIETRINSRKITVARKWFKEWLEN